MVLSKHQKLQELGIDIWKKRSEQEAIIFQDEVYLRDRNCILCLGKKDEEVSEEDKIFFLKTLAKSIGKNKFLKINKLANPELINNILLLGTDLPQYCEQYVNSKISSYGSMTEICSSKESKQLFLNKLKALDL